LGRDECIWPTVEKQSPLLGFPSPLGVKVLLFAQQMQANSPPSCDEGALRGRGGRFIHDGPDRTEDLVPGPGAHRHPKPLAGNNRINENCLGGGADLAQHASGTVGAGDGFGYASLDDGVEAYLV